METATTVMKVIPKKSTITFDLETGQKVKRKVAAYARVSTDLEDQKNSFNAQLDEYRTRIQKNQDWEFVGLYSDEGISGTCLKNRDGFKKMIKDALNGKIDLILVKSISRFARNTVDCLKTVRDLRNANVEVYFDKEAISTNDKKTDIMLTMFASFAQEESKSISENVKWGVRKRMAKGQRKMHTSTTIGYVTEPNGKVIVDESERHIVVMVFNLFLCGYTYREIGDFMEEQGILTGTGKKHWDFPDVSRILNCEKYVGDFVMQKTVVKDFLDHKAFKNNGIEEQYILENHHEAIIPRALFDFVTALRKEKADDRATPRNLENKLNRIFVCENCLRTMNRVWVHPNTPYKKPVLTCKTTAKVSEKYKTCNAENTIDYNLALKATSEVFAIFNDLDDRIPTFISGAYEQALNTISIRIKDITSKNEKLQSELTSIIKLQISSEEMEQYKFKYDQIKKLINKNNDEIIALRKDAHNVIAKERFELMISGYLKSADLLTYDLIKDLIKKAIRKKDNSIRFIISKQEIVITKSNIDELLNQKPIYESMVSDSNKELHFDVIRIGGETNGCN